MGSKGSNTTTQTQNQTYTPTGGGYITGALDKAQSAASQPFNVPQAPVAGFSQDQQQAFQQYRDAQGTAQPYYNQAASYFSPQGAQQFLNPYAANVMAGLKDVFGEQNSQNLGNLRQQAGGGGADRIAVGQANLAKQQGLVAGQTLSGLYQNSAQQAQAAGQGQMALGQNAQNSAFQGANALIGTGGLQQQLSQAQMNSPYQQAVAQAAFPYQQAQFLAGITGSLAPGLGGTTAGQSTTTKPAPSLFSQILGGVTGGVGALGTTGAFGNNGWMTGGKGGEAYGGNGVYGGSSSNPLSGLSASDYGAGFAEGGATSPYDLGSGVQDDPIDISKQSIVPQVPLAQAQPHIPQLNFSQPQEEKGSSGPGIGDIAKLAMMFVNRGGRIPYAEGGEIDMETPSTFDERFPFRMPTAEAVDKWRADTPEPAMAFAESEPSATASLPRAIRTGSSASTAAPAEAEEVSPASRPSAAAPEAPEETAKDASSSFAKSPWAALMAAGFGMMAGDSPYAGINIGKGGMEGMKVLESQRTAAQKDETIAQAAKRLAQEAKQHEDPYTRMTMAQKQAAKVAEDPYTRLTAAQKQAQVMAERKQALEELKPVQVGQDDYGRPIMAKRNPKTGEYEIIKQTPPTAGERPAAPVAPQVPGVAPGSSAPAAAAPPPAEDPAALPPNAQPTQGKLPNGTMGTITPSPTVNPDSLEGVKPSDAAKIKAISEGRARFLPLTRNNAYNRYIMDKVHEYDPATDETAFSRRSRTANGFAAGVEGRNVTAMNTFGQHAERLAALAEKLDQGDFPSWNAVKTALAREGLSEKETQDLIGAWQVDAKAIGDEGAKVFAGTNSALADREEWHKMFDINSPKSVTRRKLQEAVGLIEGRLNALTDQYNNGMRTSHEPKDLIAPKTRQVFDAITAGKATPWEELEAAKVKAGKEAPKEAAGDPDAPKAGERRQFKQGWGRWNGKDWVPE